MDAASGRLRSWHNGRPRLTNIFDVLFNSTAIYAFVHTILAALLTGGDARDRRLGLAPAARRATARACSAASLRLALPMVAGRRRSCSVFVGHFHGVLMAKQQPMKMAAADAVFETKDGAGLSLFAIGDFKSNPEGAQPQRPDPQPALVDLPPATRAARSRASTTSTAEYRAKYGPGEYAPVVAVVYWTLARDDRPRALLMFLVGAYGWWQAAQGQAGAVAPLPEAGPCRRPCCRSSPH